MDFYHLKDTKLSVPVLAGDGLMILADRIDDGISTCPEHPTHTPLLSTVLCALNQSPPSFTLRFSPFRLFLRLRLLPRPYPKQT